ncbi:hypothetical protein UCRPC4_g06584 [Phaeomoniella chlamydospora]|uniref:Uncharacterized protein n=1 Tax=Phaeomoniella chlamydospora TaxID=158046 RepID=A0A0G2DWC9_PHACM|nr:hypothetical protein UCRPC4_g06584 [Phaeomoniella chlamydospora]
MNSQAHQLLERIAKKKTWTREESFGSLVEDIFQNQNTAKDSTTTIRLHNAKEYATCCAEESNFRPAVLGKQKTISPKPREDIEAWNSNPAHVVCEAMSTAAPQENQSDGEQDKKFEHVDSQNGLVDLDDPLLVSFAMICPQKDGPCTGSRLHDEPEDVLALGGSVIQPVDSASRLLVSQPKAGEDIGQSSDISGETDKVGAEDFTAVDAWHRVASEENAASIERTTHRKKNRASSTIVWENRPIQGEHRLISCIGGLMVSPRGLLSLLGCKTDDCMTSGNPLDNASSEMCVFTHLPLSTHSSTSLGAMVHARKQTKHDSSLITKPTSFLRPHVNNDLLPSSSRSQVTVPAYVKMPNRQSSLSDTKWDCFNMDTPAHNEEIPPRVCLLTSAVDGACDTTDEVLQDNSSRATSPSKVSVDLNKALPPYPTLLERQPSIRTRQAPQILEYHDPGSAASSANSSGSVLSSSSSKAHFRQIARGLVAVNAPTSGLELSPVREPDHDAQRPEQHEPHEMSTNATERDKFESMDEHALMHQCVALASDSADERSQWPTQSKDLGTDTIGELMRPPHKSRHIPHALSENNINYLSGHIPVATADFYAPPHLASRDLRDRKGNGTQDSPTRGRRIDHSKSVSDNAGELEWDDGMLQHPQSARKRSRSPHKKLFGDGGWLTRSQSVRDVSKDQKAKLGQSPKKGIALKSWGGKMKRRIGDMTAPENGQPFPTRSTFPISLNPPMQAKIYGELELMLCVSGNKFLMDQYERGRMSPDSVAKINAGWRAKNRPQVREFQYDQLTQRELVLANVKTFEFHGDAARNAVSLNGILHSWKALAKEMSIRTFCMADTQVKKHLLDTRRVLEMFGAPLITFLAFQEVQNAAHLRIRDHQKRRQAKCENFESATAMGLDGDSRLRENPFEGGHVSFQL